MRWPAWVVGVTLARARAKLHSMFRGKCLSRLSSVLVLGLTLVLVSSGCEKSGETTQQPTGLGLDHASSNVMHDDTVPVTGENLELVTRRGVLIGWEEHIFAVALERGMGRIGSSAFAALLPIASVDEGFNSGQVTVYRWLKSDVGEDGALLPEKSRKWMVIPLLLRPDKVLENEQFDERPQIKSDAARQIDGILVATRHATEANPSGKWNPHAFPETGKDEKGKFQLQTRVYLMATVPGVPDVEVLVADRTKKKEPFVVSSVIHHADGLGPLTSELDQPGAMTVARVIAQRRIGEMVEVSTAGGDRWTIHSEDGTLVRAGGGGSEPQAEPESGS